MRFAPIVFLWVLLIGTILSGCNSTPQPIETEVKVNLEQNQSQQFKVAGTTNLPERMELMISLAGPFEYLAQSKISVSQGAFESEWFGDIENPGKQLNAGTYKVEISSSIGSVQPPNVQSKIGKDGVLLQGPHIIQEAIGGKRLKYDASTTIEGVNHRHLFSEKIFQFNRAALIEKLKKELNIAFEIRKQNNEAPEANAKVFDWAKFWLVGDPNDVQNLSVQLKKTTEAQAIYVWKTLQILFPEWKDAYSWTMKTFNEVSTISSGTKSKTIYIGNKAIHIIYSAEMKRITMSVFPIK